MDITPLKSDSAGLAALLLEHERATPGGLIYDWMDERGGTIDELRIDIDERDVDPGQYDLVISLGSEFAAYDDSVPWLEREKRLLRAATECDVPVLGICFGAQLLASVLGADCYRADGSEIGWLPVVSHDDELIPEGPWFQWHFDTFDLPAGATLLAETEIGPQAYVVGRSLGVQFHPEVTPGIMEEWVRTYKHELDAEGVDPAGLLTETRERARLAETQSKAMLNTFVDRIVEGR